MSVHSTKQEKQRRRLLKANDNQTTLLSGHYLRDLYKSVVIDKAIVRQSDESDIDEIISTKLVNYTFDHVKVWIFSSRARKWLKKGKCRHQYCDHDCHFMELFCQEHYGNTLPYMLKDSIEKTVERQARCRIGKNSGF